MKMGLNVMRVRERFAQSDDWSRIGEVLLDTSNHFLWPIRIGFCPTSGGGPHRQEYTVDLAEDSAHCRNSESGNGRHPLKIDMIHLRKARRLLCETMLF